VLCELYVLYVNVLVLVNYRFISTNSGTGHAVKINLVNVYFVAWMGHCCGFCL